MNLAAGMDSTYPVSSLPFVSNKIVIANYFNELTALIAETVLKLVQQVPNATSKLEQIACLMNVDLTLCLELDQKCR